MSSTESGEFIFYAYRPSLPAAVIFTVLFFASAGWHSYQLFRHRTWYFIPFVLGCLFEAVGYIGRCLSWAEDPDYTKNPYIIQSLLLLLGPALFAASIYMVLGRLAARLDAASYSAIPPRWMTKIFVTGDVLSFCVQGGGGGLMATAKSRDETRMGENIILGGLGIQILFFGTFIIATLIFHSRIRARPTQTALSLHTPWKKLIWVLYISSALILIRSIFRIVEYVMGSDGELLQKEVYLYIFDAVPMFITAVAFNWFHPSRVIVRGEKAPLRSVTSLEVIEGDGDGYRPMPARDVEAGGVPAQSTYDQSYGYGHKPKPSRDYGHRPKSSRRHR